MSTRDHRKSRSQQARISFLAGAFVLTLLLAPILILTSTPDVHSAEAAGTNNYSIWLDGPSQALRDETISYDIKTDAAGLYGIQLEISFDPALLQVVDPQLTPGSCPTPDFVVINTVDNSAGTLSYATSSLAPTAPCDGGIVASFQFKVSPTAVGGTTQVQFDEVILADINGTEIPSTSVDLNLEILVTEADFSAAPANGPAPLAVTFTNLSTGLYDTCTWDFGDSSGSTTCGNQSHLYSAPGKYTVSLSISGPSGSDSETKVEYIYVWQQHDVYLPVTLSNYP